MTTTLKRMLREQSGQDLAEYGIALAVVAVGAAAVATAIAVDTKTLWTRALQAIIVATIN
jgi:Flp pilus assembly pilin Flp